jgi:hypothetical protein
VRLGGEYTAACGDIVHAGTGAYSVKAAGAGLRCSRARDVAAAWSAGAETGERGGRVDGFTCTTSDAGDGALLVECTHRGNRPDGAPGQGNDKAIAWLWRGGPR